MSPFDHEVTSVITPLGLCVTLVMSLLLIVLPRRYALLPILTTMCMTGGITLVLFGFTFTTVRLLLLAGLVRVLCRGEWRRLHLNTIDYALLWFMLSSITMHTILTGGYDGFKYKLGHAYTEAGCYFLCRALLQDPADLSRVCRMIAWLLLPLTLIMLREKVTGANFFSVFGGVPALSAVRDGTVRCQGPFAISISAGTFGATVLPYVVSVWRSRGGGTLVSLFSIAGATIITVVAGSSGPILTYAASLGALCIWPLRKHMKAFRTALVVLLIMMQVVMHAPIWFLIARMSVFGSSDAYHRAYLIDRAIANVWDWWLVGTRHSAEWGDKYLQLYDITNTYLAHGVDGGLLTMMLFIGIIVYCYRGIGRSVQVAERNNLKQDAFLVWALGCALTSHAVTFMSVTYFDQNEVNWILLLAMISSISCVFLDSRLRPIADSQHTEAAPNEDGAYDSVRESDEMTNLYDSRHLRG